MQSMIDFISLEPNSTGKKFDDKYWQYCKFVVFTLSLNKRTNMEWVYQPNLLDVIWDGGTIVSGEWVDDAEVK